MRTDRASIEKRAILTPHHRLRVFLSSPLVDLVPGRWAALDAIERMRLIPVVPEAGVRPDPART